MWLDLVLFKEKNILYLINIENITWIGSWASPILSIFHFILSLSLFFIIIFYEIFFYG